MPMIEISQEHYRLLTERANRIAKETTRATGNSATHTPAQFLNNLMMIFFLEEEMKAFLPNKTISRRM